APRQSPTALTRDAGVRCNRSGSIQADAAEVLDMLRNQKVARFQEQNSEISLTLSIDFFGDVGTVHSGSDDNRVERKSSIIDRLVVGVADVTAQYVDGKSGFLYFDRVGSFLEIANHAVLHAAGWLGRGDRILGLRRPKSQSQAKGRRSGGRGAT